MEGLNKKEVIREIVNSKAKFAWINTYSDLILVKYDEIEKDIERYLDNLIEAKFFSEDKEISILATEEDDFSLFEFISGDKEYIEEEQIINNHKSPFRDDDNYKLIIRHYFEYDEDGQAFVNYTKLHDVEKEGAKNEGKKQKLCRCTI